MRVDLAPRLRALIAAVGFALLAVGFLAGAFLAKWVYQ
jgi:hypothetical protein